MRHFRGQIWQVLTALAADRVLMSGSMMFALMLAAHLASRL